MGHSATVPELTKDMPILVTHGLGNLFPAFNLGLTMNAWGMDITDTLF
jgi:hypothetical protein